MQYPIFNNISDSIHACPGVPQGTHCGPILFNLCINDLPSVIKHPNFLLFAEDVKIFTPINNVNDCHELQDNLKSVYEWCSVNNLGINIKKCFTISISPLRSQGFFTYFLGGSTMQRGDQINIFKRFRWIFGAHSSEMVVLFSLISTLFLWSLHIGSETFWRGSCSHFPLYFPFGGFIFSCQNSKYFQLHRLFISENSLICASSCFPYLFKKYNRKVSCYPEIFS